MRPSTRLWPMVLGGLAAALALSGAACAVDEDDDDNRSAAQTCDTLDNASMLGADQVGAADVLSDAARDAPSELQAALTLLAGTARQIEGLDPTAPDTASQIAVLLTDPDVSSSQSTVRGWLSTNCSDT